LNNIGSVYQDWGKPEKALEYYEESLTIFEELGAVQSAETVNENIPCRQDRLGYASANQPHILFYSSNGLQGVDQFIG